MIGCDNEKVRMQLLLLIIVIYICHGVPLNGFTLSVCGVNICVAATKPKEKR